MIIIISEAPKRRHTEVLVAQPFCLNGKLIRLAKTVSGLMQGVNPNVQFAELARGSWMDCLPLRSVFRAPEGRIAVALTPLGSSTSRWNVAPSLRQRLVTRP